MIDRHLPQRGVWLDQCHQHSPHRVLWLAAALVFSIVVWIGLIFFVVALVRRLTGSA
jgi:hypothetical protein